MSESGYTSCALQFHEAVRCHEDHIQEIVDKWRSIDDEIWAKIICMERNRRIAKAYARKHTIMVDGSRDDYLDGTTLGLNAFDNPDRDSKTSYLKQHIGEGVKLKIQQNGDIFVKRLSKASAFVHHFKFCATSGVGKDARNQLKSSQSSSDVYALNSEPGGEFYGVVGPRRQQLNTPAASPLSRFANPLANAKSKSSSSGASSGGSPTSSSSASSSSSSNLAMVKNHADKSYALKLNRLVRIFNMDKFKEVLEYESRQTTPDRVRLQSMCISIINFVYDDQKMLNLPSWIMLINIVALDLLSSKIGLIGPYDMSVALDTSGPLMSGYGVRAAHFNKLSRNKSLEQFTTANDYDHCAFELDESEPYRPFNGLSSGKSRQRLNKSTANNADSQFIMLRNRQALAGSPLQRRKQAASGGDSSNSMQYFEGRPALLEATRSEQELKPLGSSFNGGEIRSSSSGFDSNCSYQNGTPATSSSSIDSVQNNASKAELAEDKNNIDEVSKKTSSKFRRFFKSTDSKEKHSEAGLTKKEQMSCPPSAITSTTAEALARGKRPPKLPHGISAQAPDGMAHKRDQQTIMSDPIPIPAPPTSGGAGPSGKANLILVSPTGLSPPGSPKQTNQASFLQSQRRDDLLPREFETIKHIDQEGRCAVLLDQTARQRDKPARLPTGIPSHAQLAPPATQRHILRYLMSTAATYQRPPRPADELFANKQPFNLVPPTPPSRPLRRPLPVLPPGHQRPPTGAQAQILMRGLNGRPPDESLYYSGLQARLPNLQRQPRALPTHPITKGAIDSILSDFKQNAHLRRQQQQQNLNRLRQEQHLLAAIRSKSASQLGLMSDLVSGNPAHTANQAASSIFSDTTKISSVFSSKRDQSYMRSLESLNRLGKTSTDSGTSKPLASLLTHVGGFLRRSKANKVEVLDTK